MSILEEINGKSDFQIIEYFRKHSDEYLENSTVSVDGTGRKILFYNRKTLESYGPYYIHSNGEIGSKEDVVFSNVGIDTSTTVQSTPKRLIQVDGKEIDSEEDAEDTPTLEGTSTVERSLTDDPIVPIKRTEAQLAEIPLSSKEKQMLKLSPVEEKKAAIIKKARITYNDLEELYGKIGGYDPEVRRSKVPYELRPVLFNNMLTFMEPYLRACKTLKQAYMYSMYEIFGGNTYVESWWRSFYEISMWIAEDDELEPGDARKLGFSTRLAFICDKKLRRDMMLSKAEAVLEKQIEKELHLEGQGFAAADKWMTRYGGKELNGNKAIQFQPIDHNNIEEEIKKIESSTSLLTSGLDDYIEMFEKENGSFEQAETDKVNKAAEEGKKNAKKSG